MRRGEVMERSSALSAVSHGSRLRCSGGFSLVAEDFGDGCDQSGDGEFLGGDVDGKSQLAKRGRSYRTDGGAERGGEGRLFPAGEQSGEVFYRRRTGEGHDMRPLAGMA